MANTFWDPWRIWNPGTTGTLGHWYIGTPAVLGTPTPYFLGPWQIGTPLTMSHFEPRMIGIPGTSKPLSNWSPGHIRTPEKPPVHIFNLYSLSALLSWSFLSIQLLSSPPIFLNLLSLYNFRKLQEVK